MISWKSLPRRHQVRQDDWNDNINNNVLKSRSILFLMEYRTVNIKTSLTWKVEKRYHVNTYWFKNIFYNQTCIIVRIHHYKYITIFYFIPKLFSFSILKQPVKEENPFLLFSKVPFIHIYINPQKVWNGYYAFCITLKCTWYTIWDSWNSTLKYWRTLTEQNISMFLLFLGYQGILCHWYNIAYKKRVPLYFSYYIHLYNRNES